DALEIVVARSQGKPKVDEMRRLWSARWGRRAAPVALVVKYDSEHGPRAAVCGTRDDAAIILDLDVEQVERAGIAAFDAPTSSEGERILLKLLSESQEHQIPGLTNSGLFASHELRVGVPQRTDWTAQRRLGRSLSGHRGMPLLDKLGYEVSSHGSTALLLSV